MTADTAVLPRLRSLGALGTLHFGACELVLWVYFLSNAVYKRWYLAAALALAITVGLGILGHLTLRGAIRALAPFALYHAYLLTAIFRTEHRALVRFHTLADLIELAVVFLFWSVVRNHSLARLGDVFVRLPFLAAALAVYEVAFTGIGHRLGGIGLIFLPVCVPFCYEQLMRRHRPRLALLALIAAFAVLAVSRSRSPLAGAAIALALSFLFIGSGFLARLKVLAIGAVAVAGLVSVLMYFGTTRFMVLAAYVRFTGNEVVRPDMWIPAEAPDKVRQRLNELVYGLAREAQPFGLGIGGVGAEYGRYYGEEVFVHNTYHAWAVEGGLFCVLIVIWIVVRHARTLRRALRDPDLRRFAFALGIATVAILAIATFHQMHRTPALWMLLGIGAGLRTRFHATGH